MTMRDHLLARIADSGPMSLADYMATCLMHPVLGYYTTRDPFGAAGDFTTAPEISQMFGELIGLTLAQAWMDQGQPAFTLAELGPGRGTLMADVLRATKAVPGFADALSVHLVETSKPLRQVQATLVPFAVFHDSIETLPDAPLFLVANEFFDALPIRQFQRDGRGWRERVVGAVDGELVMGLSPSAPLSELAHRLQDTKDGDIVEVCPALPPIVGGIAQRIAAHGGAAVIIDYGDWNSLGDTFQAVHAHQKVDPLATPGRADLTAHVDFAAIAAACAPLAHSDMTEQGVFLERLGITQRAQALAAKIGEDALRAHIAAHRRLTAPDQMGHLFKVIGLTPKSAPPLAGLSR